MISSNLVGPHGQIFGNGVSLADVPAVCRNAVTGGPEALTTCVAAHGFHQFVTYQPDNRFWPFQGIESAIFVLIAAGCIGLAFQRVLRRDA